MNEAEKALTDYFASVEFRERHLRQHMRTICDALNALEAEGWEPRDADYKSTSVVSIPLGHNGNRSMLGMPENAAIYYDTVSHEWTF